MDELQELRILVDCAIDDLPSRRPHPTGCACGTCQSRPSADRLTTARRQGTRFYADSCLDELESGSDRPPVRPVRANFVSCNRPNAAITAITGPNPVGTIQAANTRAIALLDRVIDELQFTRNRIVAGAASGWPTISDVVGQALERRFHLNANNRNIWTRRGEGTVDVLIRRILGARQILADGSMRYVCLGRPTVNFTIGGKTCAGEGCVGRTRAVSCGGISQIVLCEPWWRDDLGIAKLDAQARTLLHECFHIYFGFIGDKGNLANAHCYDEFVLDLNGLAVPAKLVGRCP
jgi:hypothetical protein